LFSTEIAYTPEGKFVVIDYVNDQIDLRLQSGSAEGVPDSVVHQVADRLVEHVIRHRNKPQRSRENTQPVKN